MENNTGFFKTYHNPQRGWMLNIYPIKILHGIEVEINDTEYNITPSIQKVFTDTTYNTIKSMNDRDKLVFRDMLQKTGFYNRKATKGHSSSRHRYIKNDLDKNVSRLLNSVTRHKGRGVEKINIPSNIIDIYITLETLLGIKLSGDIDTITEASKLIDELYKRGEIQNKHQYRIAPNKFST